jgi:DNA polymerase-3 subunit alpha
LDHYKFEMRHYGITPIVDFNETKDSKILASQGRPFRLLSLVTGAQQRISKQGNKFGSYVLEDYSGKTEMVLFGDDYIRFSPYLQLGQAVLLIGSFQKHRYREEYEFKPGSVNLAENVKKQLTKSLMLELDVRNLEPEIIRFLESNLQNYPGNTALKILIKEPKESLKAGFSTMGGGFEMNWDMVQWLETKPEIDVKVLTS